MKIFNKIKKLFKSSYENNDDEIDKNYKYEYIIRRNNFYITTLHGNDEKKDIDVIMDKIIYITGASIVYFTNHIADEYKNIFSFCAKINNSEDQIFDVEKIEKPIPPPPRTKEEIEAKEKEYEKQYRLEYDPYNDGGWQGCDWFCIRCGNKLLPIAKDDKYWDYLHNSMYKNGTQYFLCGNKECCHNDGPLTLHHPDCTSSPAGDSYSISWIK